MADYRVFLLDEDDHIINVEVVTCPSDDEVLALAARVVSDRRGAEVWELVRLVGKMPARQFDTTDLPDPAEITGRITQSLRDPG